MVSVLNKTQLCFMHRQVASAANIEKHLMGYLSQNKASETSTSFQQL